MADPPKPETSGRQRPADEQIALLEAHGGCGTWTWDLPTGSLRWSRGFYRMLGLDPAVVRPSISVWQDMLHPEDRRDLADPASLLVRDSINERTVRLLRADGSLRYVRSFSELVHAGDGTAIAVKGVSFDITELELARAVAREARELVHAVVSVTGVTTWSYEFVGRGRSSDTAIAHSLRWVDASDVPRFVSALRQSLETAAPFALSHKRANGEPVVTAVNLLRGERGTITGWVGATRADAQHTAAVTPALFAPWAIRAARAAIGWTAEELARQAGVSFSTVRRAENDATPSLRPGSLEAIEGALSRGGAIFDANGRLSGVIRGSPDALSGAEAPQGT